MNFIFKMVSIIIFVAFFGCKNQNKSTHLKEEVTPQWKSIFNGTNLDGWTPKINGYQLGYNYKNTFRVENGVLKVSYDEYDLFTEEFGHLFYKTPYSNYKIRLQYRFVDQQVKGGQPWAAKNSGIMIHCQPPQTMLLKQGFPISLEAQLLGGVQQGEARSSGNLCTPGTHVEINAKKITEHCIESTGKTYYDNEWITAEVVVTKDSITHYIDHIPVISYSNPSIGGEFLETTSKEIQDKEGQALTGGYISLQSESHPIEFKNIEILEF
jgi:hypothetical protein